MDSVSGSLMVMVVDWLGVDWISTSPRRSVILRLTTSIPTPLPERFVMVWAVVNPGWKSSSSSSLSVSCCSGVMSDFWIACCRIVCGFMPFPSSWIWM